MTEILFGLLNTLVSIVSAQMISLYPIWNSLKWKKHKSLLFFSGLLLYIILSYFIAIFIFKIKLENLQLIKMALSVPMLTAVSFLFLKRIWQRIFLVSLAFMFGPINSGIGLYAAQRWFINSNVLFTESIATLVVTALTLPLLLLILKRLCNNPYMKQAVTFWRFIWLLPVLMFGITIMTSSYLSSSDQNLSFIIVRIFIYFALLLICYLLDTSIRQAVQAKMASETAQLERERAESLEKDIKAQKQLAEDISPESLIVCGELTLNTANRKAYLIDTDLKLSSKEFDLLAYLISRENEVMTAQEIYKAVWKSPYVSTDHAFRGCLERLRKSIAKSSYAVNYLRTDEKGYQFTRK